MAEAMRPTQADVEPSKTRKALTPEELAPYFPNLEILEYLGRGGMGVVYQARQKTLNRLVALKLLAPERVDHAKFAERFTREAQALAALNHPSIVTIYDFGQAGGFYFLLMEFVDGLNLRQLLRTRKFTPEEALAIVPQLCDALQFAHDREIVHRDIKPENLLLDKTGRIKVADFGIAKMLGPANGKGDGDESMPPENATQSAAGTPGYSAPEQTTDPQRVDNRADIYSLGVVFYEMLTGELPGKPIDPPSKKVRIDVRLDEVVLHALEQKPELRYQQVSEVKTMVETILKTEAAEAAKIETGPKRGTATANPQTASRTGGWRKYADVVVGAIAGTAAVLAVLLCLHLWSPFWGTQKPGLVTPVAAATARVGDIGVYLASLGTVDSSNSAIFTIAEDDCQEVIRKFDAHQALPVEAYNRASTARVGHGLLIGVDNQIDTSTGTLKCRTSLIPEGATLMIPGLFLKIRMLLEVKHSVILAPDVAVQRDAESAYVWVIQSDHTLIRRPVRVGTVEGNWAEIQNGLSAGEEIVSGGLNGLQDGQKVVTASGHG